MLTVREISTGTVLHGSELKAAAQKKKIIKCNFNIIKPLFKDPGHQDGNGSDFWKYC